MPEAISDNLDELIEAGVILAALWVGFAIASRYGRRFIARIADKGGDASSRADTLWSMIHRLLVLAFLVTAVLMIALTWGINIGPMLAVGSVVGVALGFGAQDLVKDVISGFFILAEDQYRIGDVIKIAGVAGVVEDIRPRVTVLRDLDGNVHYVQNGEITVTSNLTQNFAQVVLDVGIAYKASVDDAMRVIYDELERMASEEGWAPSIIEPPQMLGVDALADSAVVIRAAVKVRADDRWLVKREALRRLKNRLDAEGIEIPFPHLTIFKGE